MNVTAFGNEMVLNVGEGAFQRLRTQTAIINVPANSDMLSQVIDANNGNNAYSSQAGTTANVMTKLILFLSEFEVVPTVTDLAKSVTDNDLVYDGLYPSGATWWPKSLNTNTFPVMSMAYVSQNSYAAMLRQNNQMPATVDPLFSYRYWDNDVAVVFVNGQTLSSLGTWLYAMAHCEFPLISMNHSWDYVTPAGRDVNAGARNRVSGRHRWDGPKARVLFVEVEAAFGVVVQSISIGAVGNTINLVIDGPSVAWNGVNQAAAVVAMDHSWPVVNEAMSWWYQSIGCDEEFALAKYWAGLCTKMYEHQPLATYNNTTGSWAPYWTVEGRDAVSTSAELAPPDRKSVV